MSSDTLESLTVTRLYAVFGAFATLGKPLDVEIHIAVPVRSEHWANVRSLQLQLGIEGAGNVLAEVLKRDAPELVKVHIRTKVPPIHEVREFPNLEAMKSYAPMAVVRARYRFFNEATAPRIAPKGRQK